MTLLNLKKYANYLQILSTNLSNFVSSNLIFQNQSHASKYHFIKLLFITIQEVDTPTGSMPKNLQPGGSSGASGLEPGTSDYQDNRPIVGHDIFVEESLSIASKDIDEESEWSLDIPNSPN